MVRRSVQPLNDAELIFEPRWTYPSCKVQMAEMRELHVTFQTRENKNDTTADPVFRRKSEIGRCRRMNCNAESCLEECDESEVLYMSGAERGLIKSLFPA